MSSIEWDQENGQWVVESECRNVWTRRGAAVLFLTPEQAKALYYQLEEHFPTIDEQCGEAGE